MKDFITLKVLDVFKLLFVKLGINYPIMRKILQIKLIMDERRVPSILMNDNRKGGEGNVFHKSLLLYLLMGFIFMLFILLPLSLFYKMNIVLAMILFMATSVMISDYSSVLLDIKEKNILLPKPIDSKTINTARIVHIITYLFKIIMTISLPTIVVGSVKYGPLFGGIFLVQLLFIASFIIFLTSLLYFFILYFFDGEKLKDIINYFQIGLSVTMIIVYQMVGQIFQLVNLDVIYVPKWWNYLIPTVWFSAPYSYIIEGVKSAEFLHFSLLSVIVPIVMLIIYFKAVAPYFEGVLQKLHNNSGGTKKDLFKVKRRHKRVAGLFTFNPIENIFYRFTQNMIASERTLKLKLYPGLAFAVIFPLIFILRSFSFTGTLVESLQFFREGNYYLYLYFTLVMMANVVPMLSTSEKHQAGWIYKTLPIKDINALYKGALKGIFVKYILPVYAFTSILFLLIYGLAIVVDVIVIFFNLVLLVLILFRYSEKPLPFSQDFQYIKHSNITTLFQTLGVCGLAAAIHRFFISKDFSRLPYALVVLVVVTIMWRITFSKKLDMVIEVNNLVVSEAELEKESELERELTIESNTEEVEPDSIIETNEDMEKPLNQEVKKEINVEKIKIVPKSKEEK